MPSQPGRRSQTWPPLLISHPYAPHLTETAPAAMSASAPSLTSSSSSGPKLNATSPSPSSSSSLEDAINESPDTYFLTPIQMFDWDDSDNSDADSDADEVEWNAGIQDFALFDRDRRAASERHEHVPTKWQALIDSQASALQRAVERNRSSSDAEFSQRAWTPLLESERDDEEIVPDLTPDNSPDLREHFDMNPYAEARAARRARGTASSSSSSSHHKYSPSLASDYYSAGTYAHDDAVYDDDASDISTATRCRREHARRLRNRKLQRPGLRSSRTLSGKTHAWQRPRLVSVGEVVEAEDEDDDA